MPVASLANAAVGASPLNRPVRPCSRWPAFCYQFQSVVCESRLRCPSGKGRRLDNGFQIKSRSVPGLILARIEFGTQALGYLAQRTAHMQVEIEGFALDAACIPNVFRHAFIRRIDGAMAVVAVPTLVADAGTSSQVIRVAVVSAVPFSEDAAAVRTARMIWTGEQAFDKSQSSFYHWNAHFLRLDSDWRFESYT